MVALVAERRSERRAVTILAAKIIVDGVESAAQIRNISSAGTLIHCAAQVENGAALELVRGANRARGTVAWRRGSSIGIRFDNPIRIADWLPASEAANGEPDGQSGLPDVPSRVIAERVLEELAFVARAIENAARALATDPILSIRHATSLQQLSIGEQMLRELAVVLKNDCTADSVNGAVTGPMKQRLLRKAISGISSPL